MVEKIMGYKEDLSKLRVLKSLKEHKVEAEKIIQIMDQMDRKDKEIKTALGRHDFPISNKSTEYH